MTPTELIRVLIVDDSLIARMGIASLLETDDGIEIVAQAESGAHAIDLYRRHKPDVVLCDLRMPGLDGVKTIELLQKEEPPAHVLVFSNFEDEQNVYKAMRAGALGFLHKETSGDALFEAIRNVATGRQYLPPGVAVRLASGAMQQELTHRESQVLERMAQGLSNRQLGEALGIAEKTAEMHVSRIIAKLGARGRTDAVVIAMRKGFLALEPDK